MKKGIIGLLCIGICSMVTGQSISVSSTLAEIGGGENKAFSVIIAQSNEQVVKKEWKSLLKDYKSEKITMKKEIFGDNCLVGPVSENTIDVYAKITDKGDGNIELVSAFDLGGAYLSSSHEGYGAAQKIIKDFAVKLTKMGIEKELKEKEKELEKAEKEVERLKKENDRLHQDIDRAKGMIEDANKTIDQAKLDIETNLKDQVAAKKSLEDHKSSVAEVGEKLKKVK